MIIDYLETGKKSCRKYTEVAVLNWPVTTVAVFFFFLLSNGIAYETSGHDQMVINASIIVIMQLEINVIT